MPNTNNTEQSCEVCEERLKENEKLQKELNTLKRQLSYVSTRPLFAWGLPRRITEFMGAYEPGKPPPHPETENLLSSLANKALIGGLLGLLLSCLTIFVLFRQTSVFNRQAEVLEQQANIQINSGFYEKLSNLKLKRFELRNKLLAMCTEDPPWNAYEFLTKSIREARSQNYYYSRDNDDFAFSNYKGLTSINIYKIKADVSKTIDGFGTLRRCNSETSSIEEIAHDLIDVEYEIGNINIHLSLPFEDDLDLVIPCTPPKREYLFNDPDQG